MKAKDVMNLLNISRVTLHTYLKKGYIKASKLPGGQYNYDINSVYKLIKNNNDESKKRRLEEELKQTNQEIKEKEGIINNFVY